MRIGVPREIKIAENRVALIPAGAEALVQRQHEVLVQRGAGDGSGFTDAQYAEAGALIVDSADAVWARAEMILKVEETGREGIARIRAGQVPFTYFPLAAHQAPDPAPNEFCAVAGGGRGDAAVGERGGG